MARPESSARKKEGNGKTKVTKKESVAQRGVESAATSRPSKTKGSSPLGCKKDGDETTRRLSITGTGLAFEKKPSSLRPSSAALDSQRDAASSLPRLPTQRIAVERISTPRKTEPCSLPSATARRATVNSSSSRGGGSITFQRSQTTQSLLLALRKHKNKTAGLAARNSRDGTLTSIEDLSITGTSASLKRIVERSTSSTSLLSTEFEEYSDDDELDVISSAGGSARARDGNAREEDERVLESTDHGLAEDNATGLTGSMHAAAARAESGGKSCSSAEPSDSIIRAPVSPLESHAVTDVYDTTYLPREVAESLPFVSFQHSTSAASVTLDECKICLEKFQANDRVTVVPACLHVFHRKCITRWFVECRNSCPLCRRPVLSEHENRRVVYGRDELSLRESAIHIPVQQVRGRAQDVMSSSPPKTFQYSVDAAMRIGIAHLHGDVMREARGSRVTPLHLAPPRTGGTPQRQLSAPSSGVSAFSPPSLSASGSRSASPPPRNCQKE